jgi:hypothetical protein
MWVYLIAFIVGYFFLKSFSSKEDSIRIQNPAYPNTSILDERDFNIGLSKWDMVNFHNMEIIRIFSVAEFQSRTKYKIKIDEGKVFIRTLLSFNYSFGQNIPEVEIKNGEPLPYFLDEKNWRRGLPGPHKGVKINSESELIEFKNKERSEECKFREIKGPDADFIKDKYLQFINCPPNQKPINENYELNMWNAAEGELRKLEEKFSKY